MRVPIITQNLKTSRITSRGKSNRILRWEVEVHAKTGNETEIILFKPQKPVKPADLVELVSKEVNAENFMQADEVIMYVFIPKPRR